MPYHVRVTVSKDQPDEIKLDLTLEELEQRILGPLRQKDLFVINGRRMHSLLCHRIQVTYTDVSSEQLLTHVREEKAAGRLPAAPDDVLVAQMGRDVTDALMSGSPIIMPEPARAPRSSVRKDTTSVFVVHGRNSKARIAMFAFLRAIGLRPMEWTELTAEANNGSPYIGELLDKAFSKAQAIVVLMTPDEAVRLRDVFQQPHDDPEDAQAAFQARPNVLFEAGMALGREPARTVIVQLGRHRRFSDVAGRHIVRLDDSVARRQDLAQRLMGAGCAVNLEGTDWHGEGQFEASLEADDPSALEVLVRSELSKLGNAKEFMKQCLRRYTGHLLPGKVPTASKDGLVEEAVLAGFDLSNALRAFAELIQERVLYAMPLGTGDAFVIDMDRLS